MQKQLSKCSSYTIKPKQGRGLLMTSPRVYQACTIGFKSDRYVHNTAEVLVQERLIVFMTTLL